MEVINMGFKGCKQTEESKRKISEGRLKRKQELGYLNSPETREKISQTHLGKKATQETKDKMSLAKKGKVPKNIVLFLKKAHEVVKPKGELSYHWKGDKVGYGGLHDWIRKQLGTPQKCVRCGTTEAKRYEWCNISGEYTRDLSDWERLCVSCHRKEGFEKEEYVSWGKGSHIQMNTGRTHIRKGQRLSPETEFKKGQIPWNKGKKGVMKAWNKGLDMKTREIKKT